MRTAAALPLLFASCLHAQDYYTGTDSLKRAVPEKKVQLGVGLGLDHGGLGLQFGVAPEKHALLFLGAGWNVVGVGWNAGVNLRLRPGKRFSPSLLGMYGYTAVIQVENADKYDKTYYGPSVGVGAELRRSFSPNYWWVALFYPFRPQAYHDDLDALRADPLIEMRSVPPDVAVSVAYHFWL